MTDARRRRLAQQREAWGHYQGRRGYQPAAVYWVEQDLVVADEFRDGHVPVGCGNVRVLEQAVANLPPGITRIYAVRVQKRRGSLFADGSAVHYFAVVTNREGDGLALLQWYREKAGTVVHAHHILKNELAAAGLPSGKFAANPVTGTGSMSVPLAVSPGRSGFGPRLSLSYDSGTGNGSTGCLGLLLYCTFVWMITGRCFPLS